MSDLEKYLKKSGNSMLQVKEVLLKAGDKRMSDKLKMQDKSADELPVNAKEIADATDEDYKYGSMTDVKDAGGSDIDEGDVRAGFKPVGMGKKKKPYLD